MYERIFVDTNEFIEYDEERKSTVTDQRMCMMCEKIKIERKHAMKRMVVERGSIRKLPPVLQGVFSNDQN